MLLFKGWLRPFLALFMVPLFCQPAIAADNAEKKRKDYSEEPWKTAALYLGAFMTVMDTNFSLGTGGLSGEVNGEDGLNLDENPVAFRVDAFWRITRRNRIDFMYYDLSRDASASTRENIPDGKGGTIPIGTNTDTKNDFRIYKLSYAYSFFKNEHAALAAGLGVFVVDVDFQLKAEGLGKVASTKLTVPIPAFNLKATFAITPKWMLYQHLDLFYLEVDKYAGKLVVKVKTQINKFTCILIYLEVDKYAGKLVDLGFNLDYNFWKYGGVGIGADLVYLDYAEDKNGDDFLLEVEQFYAGLFLYVKFHFQVVFCLSVLIL